MILACQKIEKAFRRQIRIKYVNFLINEGKKQQLSVLTVPEKLPFLKSLLENMRQTTEKLFFRKALPTVIYLRLLM